VLPAELGRLTSLQDLILQGNHLRELPAELGQLTSLRTH
jgi:Leucine-rich repeat (LRR) protein